MQVNRRVACLWHARFISVYAYQMSERARGLELEREYRPDIDGLRAIAVAIVILFHLKLSGFAGGYAGVDIFFVISGYLITGNILRDIARQRFSFADFYARRARRILPTLIATIMLTFVAGILWLPPEFLRQLAKEATH